MDLEAHLTTIIRSAVADGVAQALAQRADPTSTAEAGPLLLTLPAVAVAASVSLSTAKTWAALGIIPGRVELGTKSVRYIRRLVVPWLEAGCPDTWKPAAVPIGSRNGTPRREEGRAT
jgi:hypothetical protein